MTNKRNPLACATSIIAGTLLLLSGTHGPTGTYELVIKEIPSLTKNPLILTIVFNASKIFIAISLLGGLMVILGGILFFWNHASTAKIVIGLGAGVGIPWLILTLYTLATAKETISVIAQHNILGWIGLILAFIGQTMGKGQPKKKTSKAKSKPNTTQTP